jgi:NADH dehydrogenase [ubiquinone] 1 alpha subcomplex assembly factor 6
MRNMTPNDALLADEVRRSDYERYLLSLVAPSASRPTLWAILALNAELGRIPDQVSQPVLGQMRLAWWRDAIAKAVGQGECGGNPVLLGLKSAALAGLVTEGGLTALVDAQEGLLLRDPAGPLSSLNADATPTGVALARLRLHALRIDTAVYEETAARQGVAWELMRSLRALPHAAAQGQVVIPADLAIDVPEGAADPAANRAVLKAVTRYLADAMTTQISPGRDAARLPRRLLPALGDGLFAARFLRRLRHCDDDICDPRMTAPDGLVPAVLAWAWLRGSFQAA